MLDEKGVEVRGYRTTKAKGPTIGSRSSNVKIEVAKKIKLLDSNVKQELANEHGFEIEGYNTTKLQSFKLGFRILMSKSRPQ